MFFLACACGLKLWDHKGAAVFTTPNIGLGLGYRLGTHRKRKNIILTRWSTVSNTHFGMRPG